MTCLLVNIIRICFGGKATDKHEAIMAQPHHYTLRIVNDEHQTGIKGDKAGSGYRKIETKLSPKRARDFRKRNLLVGEGRRMLTQTCGSIALPAPALPEQESGEHLLDELKMTRGTRGRTHQRRRDGQVKGIDLITLDGRYDKAAILRDAHYHQYGAMRRHGWSWSRCLSFSWALARARQERAQLAAPDAKATMPAPRGPH